MKRVMKEEAVQENPFKSQNFREKTWTLEIPYSLNLMNSDCLDYKQKGKRAILNIPKISHTSCRIFMFKGVHVGQR